MGKNNYQCSQKSSIIDVWQGFKYVSSLYKNRLVPKSYSFVIPTCFWVLLSFCVNKVLNIPFGYFFYFFKHFSKCDEGDSVKTNGSESIPCQASGNRSQQEWLAIILLNGFVTNFLSIFFKITFANDFE